jgi:hypothetical protein
VPAGATPALSASASAATAAPLRFPCPPAARHVATGDDIACAAGLQPWCAPDGRALACCPAGLAPTSGTSCGCPPGGSTARSDCPRPAAASADYTATLTAIVHRAYLACSPPNADRTDLAIDLFVDPDGRPFDAVILEAYTADAGLQRCVVARLRALRVPPPPQGFARLVYGRR